MRTRISLNWIKKIKSNKKGLLAAIALVALIPLCLFTPLKTVFEPKLFKSFIVQYEGYVELIFIAIYTVVTIIGIPGTVLTVVGGGLFGLWYGTFISIISATMGALFAFWAARYTLQNYAQRKFKTNKKLAEYQAAVLNQPFNFVLTTRLIPISPYNLVNYLFGLTSINWVDYLLATFVGVIPGCFVYTWIGFSGEEAMSGGGQLSFLLALSFLALLSIMPLIYQRKRQI